jgi:hypothetical protein
MIVMVAAQAVSAKDALIAQLQQQLQQQASSIAASTGDHETNMAKLIKSINEMQQSCQAQVGSLLVLRMASSQTVLPACTCAHCWVPIQYICSNLLQVQCSNRRQHRACGTCAHTNVVGAAQAVVVCSALQLPWQLALRACLHVQQASTACCAQFPQPPCCRQALEVQEYASAQKKLQDERRVLREQMRHMEGTITKLQVNAANSK